MTLFLTIQNIMLAVECLVLIPFTRYRKLLDEAGKYIHYYIISSVIFASVGFAMQMADINHTWFYSIMVYIQFCILSFFQYQVHKKRSMRRLIRALIIPMAVISLLDFFWWEGAAMTNSIAMSVGYVTLIVYESIFTLLLLFDKTLVLKSIFVHTLPNFWFNAGLFLFHTTSLLFVLSYAFFVRKIFPENEKLFFQYYLLWGVCVFSAGIIQMIFFYIGLRKVRQQARSRLQAAG